MLRRLATTCYRHRRLTVAAWIALLVGLTVLSGAVGNKYGEGFEIKGTESTGRRTC